MARQQLGDRDRVSYVIHPHRSSGVGWQKSHPRGTRRSSSSDRHRRQQRPDPRRQHQRSTAARVAGSRRDRSARLPRMGSSFDRARANVAYQQTHESDHCLDITVEALRRNGLELSRTLLLFTVIERVTRIYGSRLGRHAEDQVLLALREQAEGARSQQQSNDQRALAEEPVAIQQRSLKATRSQTALSNAMGRRGHHRHGFDRGQAPLASVPRRHGLQT